MKNTFLLAGILMSAGTVMAQDVSKLYSPNLFDGTVNVNVPIYEQYGMGISLSYNTKGIPVREQKGFLDGLKYDTPITSTCHQVLNIDKQIVLYETFIGEDETTMKFLSFVPQFNNGDFKSFNLLSKRKNLNKISIFFIEPLKDIFIVINGKIFITENGKLYEATAYLKRKYKTKVEFMKRVGYKVQH